MNVLIVEDDEELARQLHTELTDAGYRPYIESGGDRALSLALEDRWDIAILDVSLPGMSGFELLTEIRDREVDLPVIFLTARSDVSDRIKGLSLGGDDYLTKPFSMDELKARMQAVARRYDIGKPVELAVPDGWILDPLLRQITAHGNTICLQPREWSLLELFLGHEGEVLTNSFLLDRVWGIRFDPGTNVVDAAMCRLRKKLNQPGEHFHLDTLRGRGHVFRRHVV